MTLQLLEQVGARCSENITKTYSTSFSLASRLLGRRERRGIYAIYGFVRLADEIVDTLSNVSKRELLEEFKTETANAISRRVSLNPALHSFQWCVNTYRIEPELVLAFFRSMEADLTAKSHTEESYREYIYGSAEVVGLMCLRVFADRDEGIYTENVSGARALGAAFQKVNFLRDLRHDFEALGRCYFPSIAPNNFTADDKRRIEADIEQDFAVAREHLSKLPRAARLGVTLAYVYYNALFKRLKLLSPEQVRSSVRVRVPDSEKLFLLVRTCCQYCMGVI